MRRHASGATRGEDEIQLPGDRLSGSSFFPVCGFAAKIRNFEKETSEWAVIQAQPLSLWDKLSRLIQMAISPGDKLGHYEVLSLLRQGGIGEVSCAYDTRLKCDGAIKELPAAPGTPSGARGSLRAGIAEQEAMDEPANVSGRRYRPHLKYIKL